MNPSSSRPVLTVRTGGAPPRDIPLTSDDALTIGRDASCDIALDDSQVSRRHAEIQVGYDGAVVADLGSRNGTFIDGQRIAGPTRLAAGSTLRIGDTELTLRVVGAATDRGAVAGPPPVLAQPAVGGAAGRTPSMVERSQLRRMVRRSNRVAIVAFAVAAIAVVTGGVLAYRAATTPKVLTPAEVISVASPSVFRVRTEIADDESSYTFGTAWAYDGPGGLLVTNNHVIAPGPPWDVKNLSFGKHPIELVGTAPCEDLAVVRVKGLTGLTSLPLADQSEIRSGDMAIALGYPASFTAAESVTATTGVVSVARVPLEPFEDPNDPAFTNTITTDAAINPGNSGGPLLDARGRVIGVDTLSNTQHLGRTIQGQAYALGIDRVRTIVDKLAKGTSYGWFGMAGFTSTLGLSKDTLAEAGFPADKPGLIPDTITPGGSAAKAEFESLEQLIVAVDGKPLNGTVDSLCDIVGEKATGDTIQLTIYSANVPDAQTIELKLE